MTTRNRLTIEAEAEARRDFVLLHDGERVFRDHSTGYWFKDLSCWRPYPQQGFLAAERQKEDDAGEERRSEAEAELQSRMKSGEL